MMQESSRRIWPVRFNRVLFLAAAAGVWLAAKPVSVHAGVGQGAPDDPAGSGDRPSFQVRSIFPTQPKHAHSSSIVEMPSGDLLACWYLGSGERRANDVAIQGSVRRKGASDWGPVFPMADTPGLPDCNPVLFVDGSRRIWLFWIVPVANRWEHSVLKFRRADFVTTDGRPVWTWQDSIHLVPGDEFVRAIDVGFESMDPEEDLWAEYALPYSRLLREAARDPIKRQTGWMPRTHPITLPSGRILVPLYSDGFNLSLMAISDDHGESWRAGKPIVGLGPIQPSVVRRNDGTLVAYLRDSGGAPARVQRSHSTDDGESWSIAVDSELPNPGSSIEAVRLQDGKWLMAYNDTESGRHRLALAFSPDEGRSWRGKRIVEQGTPGVNGYSYPSLMEAADGSLHLTYSDHGPAGETIRHAEMSRDWAMGRE